MKTHAIAVVILVVFCSVFCSRVNTPVVPMSLEPTVTSTLQMVTPTVSTTLTVLAIATATATPIQVVISENDFLREPMILEIPKIQVKSPLGIAKQNQDKLDFSSLAENPVLVETRQIGENGVALIIGHRQWGINPKVFAKLDRLRKGDLVIIGTERVTMTFEVEESIIVRPSAVWQELERLDALFVQRETPAVVLLTCTPYGTSQKRLLVIALKSEGEK